MNESISTDVLQNSSITLKNDPAEDNAPFATDAEGEFT